MPVVISSDLSTEARARLKFTVPLSVTGSSSHVQQYQQPLQLRTSQSESLDTRDASEERLLAKSRTRPTGSMSKSQGLTMLQRQLAKPSEAGNQCVSLPLKVENLGGNIQFLAAKSSCRGGQTSLVPVVVSGDEIYQFQEGQGVQKSVLFLSNSQSASVTEGQNLNLTGLLSTSSKVEGPELQASKLPTSFPKTQAVTGCGPVADITSGQVTASSVSSVPKINNTQSIASPVYKSKLEKAMAQNLLMQSSAKSTVNKTSAVSFTSQVSSPETTTTLVPLESSHVKSDLCKRSSKTTSGSQEFFQSNLASNLASPVKSTLKVSKVAEYYKSLVAGKGTQQVDKQLYFQQPLETISKPQFIPQYSIVPDVTNFHTNPKVMDVFNASEANAVSSAGFELTSNTDTYSTFPSAGGIEQEETVVKEKNYEDHSIGKSILSMLWGLRKDNLFCDAVLYAGSNEIKVHYCYKCFHCQHIQVIRNMSKIIYQL